MKKAWPTVKALIALAAIIAVILAIGNLIWSKFSSASPDTRLAITALSGIVASPVISYFTTRATNRRSAANAAWIERKVGLYDTFVRTYLTGLTTSDSPKEQQQAVHKLQEMMPDLMMYASNGVLKQWRVVRGGNLPEDQILYALEELIKKMRSAGSSGQRTLG